MDSTALAMLDLGRVSHEQSAEDGSTCTYSSMKMAFTPLVQVQLFEIWCEYIIEESRT